MTNTRNTPKATSTKTTPKAVATKKAPVAPAPTTKVAKTFEVGKATSHTCRTCGVTKALTSFPTTGRDGVRGTECRACRDADKIAARKASKAPVATAPAKSTRKAAATK